VVEHGKPTGTETTTKKTRKEIVPRASILRNDSEKRTNGEVKNKKGTSIHETRIGSTPDLTKPT